MTIPRRGHHSQSVCAGQRCRCWIGGWLVVLLIMGIFHGCKPREVFRETPQMDTDAEDWIRIRLCSDITTCVLTSPSALNLNYRDEKQASFSINASDLRVDLKAGRLTAADPCFAAVSLDVIPERPHLVELDGQTYRGELRLQVNDDGASFEVINRVPLEPYLAGVIGKEMPPYWEPEALKAQAIAARTYCLYIKQRFGQQRDWDLSGTQAHQVYGGVRAESDPVWDAVQATDGRILRTYTLDGSEQLFPAYYSAICGGHTEDSRHVFGEEAYTALAGVPCAHCQGVARLGQYFWPMAVFDKKTVSDRLLARYPSLARLESITQIVPIQQSRYDGFTRITRVKLVGVNGKTDTLRAEDLRLSIDPGGRKIRSTICRLADWEDQWAFLSGRGWGHGVGLCQCGAQKLARQGWQAEQILAYYYPDAELHRLY